MRKKWLLLAGLVTCCLPKVEPDGSEATDDGFWERAIIYTRAEEGESYICAPTLDAGGKDCMVVEALPLLLGCDRPGYAEASNEMVSALKASLVADERSVEEYRNYCAIVPLSGADQTACQSGEATTERGYCVRDERPGCDVTYKQAIEFTTSVAMPLPARDAYVLVRCPSTPVSPAP